MTLRYALIWTLFCAPAIYAQALPPAAKAAEESISADRIRAHVRFLASDLLEGRAPGQRGGELAAEYIATQFMLDGLKPAGDGGTFFQRVPLAGVTTVPEGTSFSLVPKTGRAISLRFADDYVSSNQTQTDTADIDAPIVWVGHGIDAPEYAWNDFKGVDVRGKVILVLVNEPESSDEKFFKGKALTYYGRWTYKFDEAARKGAVGALIIHRTDLASYGWEVVRNSWSGEHDYLQNDPLAKLKAASWIQLDIANQLFAAAGLDGSKEIAAAGKRGFVARELPVRLRAHIVDKVRRFNSTNVVGILTGTNTSGHDQAVMYTAHYDHFGIGPSKTADHIYNGAADNATGCGILLEMAHAFAHAAVKPPHSVIFASVTAEEQGLLGSEYLGMHPPIPAAQISLDLNYDMLLPIGDPISASLGGAERTTFYPQVEATAKEFHLSIEPDANPMAGHYYRSDHFSLARVGIPAFSIGEGSDYSGHPKGWGQDQYLDFNKNRYHQPGDEYNPSMDFTGNAKMAKFGFVLGWRALEAKSPVQWQPGDEFEAARETHYVRPVTVNLLTWTSMAGSRNSRATWTGRLVLLLFAGAMFIATWAAWPSLVVDCGREMYVPAALAQGKQLYRDVQYPYGPLAPSVNALAMSIFGVHLNTLYGVGLAVFSSSALVLHSIALRFLPPIGALVCGLGFLAPGFQSGVFNNILPYSCAATFGTLLTLLTLLFLLRHLENRSTLDLLFAGLFAALAVVSKYEYLLPCAGGVAAGVLLHDLRRLKAAAFDLLPGLLLAAGVYAWLIHEYGLDFLIHANWMTLPGSYFVQHYGALWAAFTGMRFVPKEIAALAFRAFFALLLWLAFARLLQQRRWIAAAAGVLTIVIPSPLAGHFLPPPALTLSAIAIAGFFLLRAAIFRKPAPRAELAIFGIYLLLPFRTPMSPADLAFPLGMFLVVFGFGLFVAIDARIRRRIASPALLLTVGMSLLLAVRVMMQIVPGFYALYYSSLLFLAFLVVLWRIVDLAAPAVALPPPAVPVAAYFGIYALLFALTTGGIYRGLPWPLIQTPMGQVRRTPDNVALVTRFLPVMQQAKKEGKRVLLLPEITGLYFIAGMLSPSRYEVLSPGVLEPGKYTDIYLRELDRNPPDLILLSNRRTSEYGVDYFGYDYDQKVLAWIQAHYRVSGEISHFERRIDAPLAALAYTPQTQARR